MSDTPARDTRHAPSALPVGTRLGEFEVRELLGVGGFGIVYLAFDHALEREVALKEYMPQAMVNRTQTLHVSLRAASDADSFAVGLRSFVNEARMLAHFNHPSLLKVHRFWEANGTAYMAMPLYRGRTLKDVAHELRGPPSEAWIRDLLGHLGGALEQMHAEGTYHRDIAPDNILLEDDGRPVLLDFGAARRVLADRSQNLTAILKPSYAPIEQYAETSAIKQGPWTDLYALGATLHYMLLGKPPPPATSRALHDEMLPLAQQDIPGVGQPLRAIIDWMLAPRPADRLPSVAVLRDALAGRVAPPAASASELTVRVPPRSAVDTPTQGNDPEATITLPKPSATLPPTRFDATAPGAPAASTPPPGTEATVVLPRAVPAPRRQRKRGGTADDRQPSEPDAAAATKTPLWWLMAAGAAAILLALLGWVLQRPPQVSAPPAAQQAASGVAPASAPLATAVPAPLPPTAPTAAVAPGPVAGAKPAASGARPAAAPPAASAPARATVAGAGRPGPAAPATDPSPSAPPATPVATPTRTAAVGTPSPASRAGASPTTAPAAAPPVASPQAKCAGLNFLANFNCMRRECMAEPLSPHPECVAWRDSGQNKVDPNSR